MSTPYALWSDFNLEFEKERFLTLLYQWRDHPEHPAYKEVEQLLTDVEQEMYNRQRDNLRPDKLPHPSKPPYKTFRDAGTFGAAGGFDHWKDQDLEDELKVMYHLANKLAGDPRHSAFLEAQSHSITRMENELNRRRAAAMSSTELRPDKLPHPSKPP